MSIQKVIEENIPSLKAIAKASLMQEVDASESEKAFLLPHIISDIDTFFFDERSIFLKAGAEQVLGYILVRDDRVTSGKWHLIHLFTDPEHKQKGLGKMLVTHAIERIKMEDRSGQLILNSSNNAVGFYKRMGFSLDPSREPKSASSTPMIMQL